MEMTKLVLFVLGFFTATSLAESRTSSSAKVGYGGSAANEIQRGHDHLTNDTSSTNKDNSQSTWKLPEKHVQEQHGRNQLEPIQSISSESVSVEDVQFALKRLGDVVKALLNDVKTMTTVSAKKLSGQKDEIPAKIREEFNRSLQKAIDAVDKFFKTDDAIRMFRRIATFLSAFLSEYALTMMVQALVHFFK